MHSTSIDADMYTVVIRWEFGTSSHSVRQFIDIRIRIDTSKGVQFTWKFVFSHWMSVCIFVGIDWNDFNYIDGSLSWMFGEAFKYKPKIALIDFPLRL